MTTSQDVDAYASLSAEEQAFLTEAQPKLAQLEEVRLIKLDSYTWRKKWALWLSPILMPLCGWADWLLLHIQSSDKDIAGLTFLVGGAIYWWVTQPKRDYARAYKQSILPDLAQLFGHLTYGHQNIKDVEEYEASQIIPDHTHCKSDDSFAGHYKNLAVRIAEIHLEREQRSGKRRNKVSVFKGLMMAITFPSEKFHGHTIVLENQGVIGAWFKEKFSSMPKAEIVDPEFEKKFDAFTSDQVEARTILDPLMIERIKSIEVAASASQISAAFYGRRVLLMVPTQKNFFEPASLHVPATDPDSVVTMRREIALVFSLIDRLLLQKIGQHDTDKITLSNQPGPMALDY